MSETLTLETLATLRVVDLREELKARGLKRSGRKAELVARLREHLQAASAPPSPPSAHHDSSDDPQETQEEVTGETASPQEEVTSETVSPQEALRQESSTRRTRSRTKRTPPSSDPADSPEPEARGGAVSRSKRAKRRRAKQTAQVKQTAEGEDDAQAEATSGGEQQPGEPNPEQEPSAEAPEDIGGDRAGMPETLDSNHTPDNVGIGDQESTEVVNGGEEAGNGADNNIDNTNNDSDTATPTLSITPPSTPGSLSVSSNSSGSSSQSSGQPMRRVTRMRRTRRAASSTEEDTADRTAVTDSADTSPSHAAPDSNRTAASRGTRRRNANAADEPAAAETSAKPAPKRRTTRARARVRRAAGAASARSTTRAPTARKRTRTQIQTQEDSNGVAGNARGLLTRPPTPPRRRRAVGGASASTRTRGGGAEAEAKGTLPRRATRPRTARGAKKTASQAKPSTRRRMQGGVTGAAARDKSSAAPSTAATTTAIAGMNSSSNSSSNNKRTRAATGGSRAESARPPRASRRRRPLGNKPEPSKQAPLTGQSSVDVDANDCKLSSPSAMQDQHIDAQSSGKRRRSQEGNGSVHAGIISPSSPVEDQPTQRVVQPSPSPQEELPRPALLSPTSAPLPRPFAEFVKVPMIVSAAATESKTIQTADTTNPVDAASDTLPTSLPSIGAGILDVASTDGAADWMTSLGLPADLGTPDADEDASMLPVDSVDEFDLDMEIRVQELRDEIDTAVFKLRNGIRRQVSRLPFKVRNMPLGKFFNQFHGSVDLVIQEDASQLRQNLEEYVASTPSLSVRRSSRISGAAGAVLQDHHDRGMGGVPGGFGAGKMATRSQQTSVFSDVAGKSVMSPSRASLAPSIKGAYGLALSPRAGSPRSYSRENRAPTMGNVLSMALHRNPRGYGGSKTTTHRNGQVQRRDIR